MNFSLQTIGVGLLTASSLATTASIAQNDGRSADQNYPNKPVRLIVPFAAGSTTDIISRIVSQKLSEVWGQQLVVDNRTGAGGAIATEAVARAIPDGYTTLIGGTATLAIIPAMERKLSYDPQKDFAPVSVIATIPYLLVLHPSVPAKSVKELIALAKSKPGVLNVGSGGIGTTAHLSAEIFAAMAKINIVHVPYKSGEKIDLIAGHIQMLFNGIPGVLPQLESGKLKTVGITSGKRSALLPEVPTITESGLPGYDLSAWLGMLAPAKTPTPVVNRLNAGLHEALRSSSLRDQLRKDGVELMGSSPEQFAAFIKLEMAKWGQGVKHAGLNIEK